MVSFVLRVAHLRPVVAAVAAHGATDMGSCRWPPWYALCCFAPMHPVVVTLTFMVGSLIHFAEDLGSNGSIALHSLAGVVALLCGTQAGLELMMSYLACIHTPLHYARCWKRRRWRALLFAGIATVIAMRGVCELNEVCISHTVQRIVAAHVFTEHSIGAHSRLCTARDNPNS